uniref:Uncharacterized protein n=1 Tax=viral metagenome TaxID=1070528 RepID=A0A6C0H4V6_9ZZZZ
MKWITFEKMYKEEPNNYHLLSSCFFIKDKYIKTTYGKVRDESLKKQKMIMNCIEEHAKKYDNGEWDNKSVRLRVYYDWSLEKSDLWKIIRDKYLHHPFFQWIKYEIAGKKDYNNPDIHIGLIGTIVRFHPLFTKNEKIKVISIIDLDNMYTGEWKKEVDKFVDSSYNVMCFSSILNIPFYGSIIGGISDDLPCGYWIAAGFLTCKVRLPYERWNNMMEYVYSNSILYKLRFFDSFKYAIFKNEEDRFFEDYEYGLDEIIINNIINYYIKIGKLRMMVVLIRNRPNVSFFRKRILDFLEWNNLKTARINNLLNIYKVKTFNELKNKIYKMETLKDLTKLLNKKETIDLLNGMQFDKRLICIIKEYNEKEVEGYTDLSVYFK